MEPRTWQLKNRIAYVDNLNSGVFGEIHGNWVTDCGVCAIGAGIKTMQQLDKNAYKIYENKDELFTTLLPFSMNNGESCSATNRYDSDVSKKDKERLYLSEFFGLNYLEIKKISDMYEGYLNMIPTAMSGYVARRKTHKEIAIYIQETHIDPYMYMLGHYKGTKRHDKVPC